MVEKITVTIHSGTVEVVKFGRGPKAFVILPGLCYDGFFEQAGAVSRAYGMFAEAFTCYLVDRNKTPRADCTVREIADDTAEVLEKLNVETADVFGASLGGMVAQELAIRHPELLDRLVLGSTLSRPNATALAVLSQWEALAAAGKIDELTANVNQTIYSPQTLERYASVFSRIRTVVTAEKTARFLAYLGAAKSFNVLASLQTIKAKTLVIGAAEDKVTTAAGARETANALGCDYYEYPVFGHAVYDEAPDYKQRMLDFFTRG